MTRCIPGDIAVITGSKSRGGMLNGCMLRCVTLAYADYWVVEPLCERLRAMFASEGEAAIWDRRLRPISPGDITEREVRELYDAPPVKAREPA